MKKKTNITIFIVIIIFIILLISLLIIISNKKEKEPIKKVDKVEYVDSIVKNEFFNKNISTKELDKTMNSSLSIDITLVGKDSAIRYVPNDEIVKKYKLEKYISTLEDYASKIEDIALENIEYRVIEKDDNRIKYEIKPWYMYKLNYDLRVLKEEIIKDSGFNVNEDNVFTDEYYANEIKARTIAIKILYSHIDDYYNKDDEKVEFNLVFKGDKPTDSQLFSLYLNMQGVTSKTSPMKMSQQDLEKEENKIINYLKDEEEKGSYNKKNPYK